MIFHLQETSPGALGGFAECFVDRQIHSGGLTTSAIDQAGGVVVDRRNLRANSRAVPIALTIADALEAIGNFHCIGYVQINFPVFRLTDVAMNRLSKRLRRIQP